MKEKIETDLWSLSFSQLAQQCQSITVDTSSAIGSALRAEAGRLTACWQDALRKSNDGFEKRERQAIQLDGLRKRTIEILIKIGRFK